MFQGHVVAMETTCTNSRADGLCAVTAALTMQCQVWLILTPCTLSVFFFSFVRSRTPDLGVFPASRYWSTHEPCSLKGEVIQMTGFLFQKLSSHGASDWRALLSHHDQNRQLTFPLMMGKLFRNDQKVLTILCLIAGVEKMKKRKWEQENGQIGKQRIFTLVLCSWDTQNICQLQQATNDVQWVCCVNLNNTELQIPNFYIKESEKESA